ncbi:hypothetical protein GKC49_10765 [Pantoea agglomerans]|uniref:Uncharacterized protein n=1 Tax=Enterobacter agglomerans TaxID=549 RepID=A0A7X2SVI9_ENTAG|nr:hypothetical protein [Pantoea agglomerans]
MHIDEIPAYFLQGDRICLTAPDLNRTEEMQRKLNDFSPFHHEFLLWSPGLAVYHNKRAIQSHSKQNAGFPL